MVSRIVTGLNQEAASWVRKTYPESGLGQWDKFTSLVLKKGLEIQAATFYTDYYPDDSADLHIAALGGNWLSRPFLRASFRYPFIQLGVRRIGARVSAENAPSLRFVRHLGFVQEGIARQAWTGGVDTICFGMLRSECRFLDGPEPDIWSAEEFGKAVSANSARSGRDSQRAVGS